MNVTCKQALIALAMSSWISGCSVPGTTLRHDPPNPQILGIAPVLSETQRADVVLIHGMCPKGVGWVRDANSNLAAALGMSVTKAGNAKRIGEYGGELYESEISDGSRVVKTYAILWSPAAAPARRLLCYDTDKPTPSCPAEGPHLPDHRAVINGELKNTIMDDCLSEAVYAVGEEGIRVIGSTIEEGLARALAGGGEAKPDSLGSLLSLRTADVPLFVVTQSLGSKLFVDAAIRMANRSCEAFKSMTYAMGRTVQVFMEANQLPILSLAYNPSLQPNCFATR